MLKLWKLQDLFVMKSPKQSLRLVLLVFAVVCGIYILSMCINQTSNYNSLSIHVINRHNCHYPIFQEEDIHHLHFPQEECACNPVRFFAILSMQRSGSGCSSKNECSAAIGFKWMLNQAEVLAKYKPVVNMSLLIPKLRRGMHRGRLIELWNALRALDTFFFTMKTLSKIEQNLLMSKSFWDCLKENSKVVK
ncbi:hypothetical protein K7X08_013753 [Anisodus acutangulus]|uniref:Uncharacterized protein n=1 Tax=Anisodus acutangulus TaxID=402998 RepID=A0A9Q1R4E2_9SOLA|nr:hypothetical protein K7X08_013753 [Anisodus acutangulus]